MMSYPLALVLVVVYPKDLYWDHCWISGCSSCGFSMRRAIYTSGRWLVACVSERCVCVTRGKK